MMMKNKNEFFLNKREFNNKIPFSKLLLLFFYLLSFSLTEFNIFIRVPGTQLTKISLQFSFSIKPF